MYRPIVGRSRDSVLIERGFGVDVLSGKRRFVEAMGGDVGPQLKLPQLAAPQFVPAIVIALPKELNTPSHTTLAEPSVIFCGVPS